MVFKILIFGVVRVGFLGILDNCVREDWVDFFFRKILNLFEIVSMVGVFYLNLILMILVEMFGYWFFSFKII